MYRNTKRLEQFALTSPFWQKVGQVGEMTSPLRHRVGPPLAHEDSVIGDGDDIREVIPDNCRG